jgi:class 3 adenylate cyclase
VSETTSLLVRAREASGRRDWHEAYELLSTADRERALGREALPFLAEAAYLVGHPEVAREAWERLHAAAARDGDVDEAVWAALQTSGLLIDAGLFSLFHGWVRRVQGLLDGRPESAQHGVLAVQRAFVALISGHLDEAASLARTAFEVATRFGDASTLALARVAEGRVLVLRGDLPEGLSVIDEAAVAATTGELDLTTTAIVYCSVVCSWQALGEYERAEEWTDAMQRWAGGHEGGAFHGWCRVHRAEILRLRGECHDAEREVHQACEEIRTYAKADLGWPLNELGQIRLRLGDLAGAEEAFLQAHEASWEPQPGLALLRLAQGDVDAAMASIHAAVEDPSSAPSWEVPPNTELRRAPRLAAQVEIALAAGATDVARGAAEELDDIAARFGSAALRASAATARGAVQLADGDAAGATIRLNEGIHRWHELGAPFETARARLRLAEALRRGGHDEGAKLELSAARSAFERLGAHHEVRAAEVLLAEKPAPVTVREQQVFMFTDIVRSTNLVEAIGDDAWQHLVRWHDETLRSLVAAHAGEVVRSMGDGLFVTFGSAAAALECAVAIQRALDLHRREHGFSPWVRIGLHRAEATSDGADWSGVGVHAAARIGALADADEILVSSETAEEAGSSYELSEARSLRLKGISEPVEVVTVRWQ